MKHVILANMADKYFSTPQIAKMLGISRIAVFKQIKSGSLPAIKAGRSYIVAKSDLLELYKKKLDRELKSQKKRKKIENVKLENTTPPTKTSKKITPRALD